jgi:Acyl dehydratase
MGLNRDYINLEFPPTVHEVTEEAVRQYAKAYGSSNVLYYNGTMAPPIYAVVYELPMLEKIWCDEELHGGIEEMKRNVLMLVHGEQQMRFYKPIRPGDKITARAKVKDIEDKGSGELIILNVTSTDQSGEKVVESDWGIFIRGTGSRQKPKQKSEGKKDQPQVVAESQPVFRKVIRVDKDITYRYAEASGDRNPIHVDEKVAKAAGLNGIIVHGLCTMAMTMGAVVDCYLDGDPTKLTEFGVRFASPVYPGDILVAEGWETGKQKGTTTLGIEVKRQENGIKVIKKRNSSSKYLI